MYVFCVQAKGLASKRQQFQRLEQLKILNMMNFWGLAV